MRLGSAILVGSLGLAMPASAEEIIYFTSGSAIPARGHEVKGDMIHLDLGGDALIAFPVALVERIESASGIDLKPSRANIVKSGPADINGAFPARGLEVTTRQGGDDAVESDPHIKYDPRTGLVGYVENPAQGDRSTVFTGRSELRGLASSDAFKGTSRMGNKFVIKGGPQPVAKARTVGLQMKGTSTYPPPSPEPPAEPDAPPADGEPPQGEPDPAD
jgi:hypothetical protein